MFDNCFSSIFRFQKQFSIFEIKKTCLTIQNGQKTKTVLRTQFVKKTKNIQKTVFNF